MRAFARSVGLEQASGNHVYFVDADDVLDCDFVFKLLNILEFSDADFIKCSVQGRKLNWEIIREKQERIIS